MPTAHESSLELRRLADALDSNPDMIIARPMIYLGYNYGLGGGKDGFLNFAKVMPRPFDKVYGATELELRILTDAIHITACINRDKVCRIVTPAQPAQYECEPLFSDSEEEGMTA